MVSEISPFRRRQNFAYGRADPFTHSRIAGIGANQPAFQTAQDAIILAFELAPRRHAFALGRVQMPVLTEPAVDTFDQPSKKRQANTARDTGPAHENRLALFLKGDK